MTNSTQEEESKIALLGLMATEGEQVGAVADAEAADVGRQAHETPIRCLAQLVLPRQGVLAVVGDERRDLGDERSRKRRRGAAGRRRSRIPPARLWRPA